MTYKVIFEPRTTRWVMVSTLIAIGYLFVAMNTPLVIMVWQAYDDDLFVRIGRSLAGGRWLGAFDHLTLAKGPGYPVFLAVSYWSGLPVSLTHAAFYCFSLIALAFVVFRKTGSYLLAFLIFAFPLWHPKILEPARVVRDSIYMSQMILLLAAFSYCLFVAGSRRTRILSAIFAGLLMGWLWLTRDEGVGILPGMFVLVFFAFVRDRRKQEQARTWRFSLLTFAVFSGVLLLFSTLNFFTYGKFVGIDFKERNFQAAMSAMEGVQQAKAIPFVAVPRATRMQIYAISPEFASLKPILDPPSGHSPWEAGGCLYRPSACGDIGNGFFMWAVRDAAGKLGHYRSPQASSSFFRKIRKDIDAACKDGRLSCKRDFVPLLPPITAEQWARIPASVGELIRGVQNPGEYPGYIEGQVIGPENRFDTTLAFLNNPQYYPKTDALSTSIQATGWYYEKVTGDAWFSLTVSDLTNSALPYSLERVGSQDLVASQKDDRAKQQRFVLSTRCGKGCKMNFVSSDGSAFSLPISEGGSLPAHISVAGNALVAFDPASAVEHGYKATDDIKVRLASRIRALIYPIYKVVMPVLSILGVMAFIVSIVVAMRRRLYPFSFVLACCCWVWVVSRAAILVLVDISSFPAIHVPYLLPIYSLVLIAAVLSISATRVLLQGWAGKAASQDRLSEAF